MSMDLAPGRSKLVADPVELNAKHILAHCVQPGLHSDLKELLNKASPVIHGLDNARLVHRQGPHDTRLDLDALIDDPDEIRPVVLCT